MAPTGHPVPRRYPLILDIEESDAFDGFISNYKHWNIVSLSIEKGRVESKEHEYPVLLDPPSRIGKQVNKA